MTLIELKAQAYDLLAQRQMIEKLLVETNQAIEAKLNEAQKTTESNG